MQRSVHQDSVMVQVRNRFEASGFSLHELGIKMGYPEATARKSAWQFMRTKDPRISMLRRFAKAMGVSIRTLVAEPKGGDGEQEEAHAEDD